MILQTERLTLRRFTEDDLDTPASWPADPVFTRYLGGVRARRLMRGKRWRDQRFAALAAKIG